MRLLRLGLVAALLFASATGALSASDTSFPKPISSDLPMYPGRAWAARVAGTVRLRFVVDGNGKVARAQVISGNPLLRDAALATVRSWKFQANSVLPNVRHETEFVYVLNVQSKKGEPKLTVSMTDFRRVEVVTEMYVEPIE